MRTSLRFLLATVAASTLAACSDSPTEPRSAVADHLSAVADSVEAMGDPFASVIRQASISVRRAGITSSAAQVVVTVDGVAIPMQAIVIEDALLPGAGSYCNPSCGDPNAPFTIRTLLAWDGEEMRRFVRVEVTSIGGNGPSYTSNGVYGERSASGPIAKAYWGISTTTAHRTSTGPGCGPRRGGDELGLVSCALAGFDFAFAWDGRAYDPRYAPENAFIAGIEDGAPHLLSMPTSQLIGYAIVQKVPFDAVGSHSPVVR